MGNLIHDSKDYTLSSPTFSIIDSTKLLSTTISNHKIDLKDLIDPFQKLNVFESNIGQLIINFDSFNLFGGTGCLVYVDDNIPFVITSANNLIINDQYAKQILFQCCKLNNQNYLQEFIGEYFNIYGELEENNYPNQNLAIAAIQLKKSESLLVKKLNINYQLYDESVFNLFIQKICLFGYPINSNGELYKFEVEIKKIEKLQNGRTVLFFEENLPDGFYGAPIFTTFEGINYLIAIYIGYDLQCSMNICMIVTNHLSSWIKSLIGQRRQQSVANYKFSYYHLVSNKYFKKFKGVKRNK